MRRSLGIAHLDRCAATLAVALHKAAADERRWHQKLSELRHRRPRNPIPAPAGSQSSAGMSRRAALFGATAATAAIAIAVPGRSNQNPQSFLSTGPVQALRSMQSKLADSVSIKDYGAIGDGNSHPLSSIVTFSAQPTSGWTLDQWQAIFPFATALSNEIDGLAIQAAANTGKAIRVPSGSYLCSLSITTDGPAEAIIFGDGNHQSEIRTVTSAVDGWRHGMSTAATGVFHATGISFTTTGTGAAAINANFSPFSGGVAVPYFVLDTVFFIGAVNCGPTAYWEHAVLCTNMPRGLSLRDVTAFGLCDGVAAGAGFQFNATGGSFGYQLMNVVVSNYNLAFSFGYNGTSGIEGVEMFNCQAYNGNVFVEAVNTVSGYLPPQFSFITSGTQLDGIVFNLQGLQDVVIENTLIETNAISYAEKPLIDLSGCYDVWISRTHCNVDPSATHVVFSHCDGTCFDINYDFNTIVNFGSMDYVYDWNSNPATNIIREFRTAFRGTGTITNVITNDAGGNQISQAWLNAYITSDIHATVDFAGTYHLGAFASGRTDSNGQLHVTFPTRPGTGLPLFLKIPHVVATPENPSGSAASMMTIVGRTRTYFTIKFAGLGAGKAVRINYMAYGE
jgi:hypothetical protein